MACVWRDQQNEINLSDLDITPSSQTYKGKKNNAILCIFLYWIQILSWINLMPYTVGLRNLAEWLGPGFIGTRVQRLACGKTN